MARGNSNDREPPGADDVTFAVLRAVIVPEEDDESAVHLFAVDSGQYGLGLFLSNLRHLCKLSDDRTMDGLPDDAELSPVVYATNGPIETITRLAEDIRLRVDAFFHILEERALPDLRRELDQKLREGSKVTADTLVALACAEIIEEDDRLKFPHTIFHVDEGRATFALYCALFPDADVEAAQAEAVVDAWQNISDEPGESRPWTRRDALNVINNPRYGYGLVLEPTGDVAATVDLLVKSLANRPRSYTLDDLDREFQALFQRLEKSGCFVRRPDIPPVVEKNDWLSVHLHRIEELRSANKTKPPAD